MKIHLFDDYKTIDFYPITLTRPNAELRIGVDTITQKWNRKTELEVHFLTRDYLTPRFPSNLDSDNIYVNGRILPDQNVLEQLFLLKKESVLVSGEFIMAARTSKHLVFDDFYDGGSNFTKDLSRVEYSSDFGRIEAITDLFSKNDQAIRNDFRLLTENRESLKLDPSNTLIGDPNQLFIEEGAEVLASVVNTKNGPVYISRNATVMEGSLVRGPFVLGESSTLKMGAKIYGATTIGPHCKVGGEVNNSMILGFSNKAHDGFLGNSVIGEWCNIGADSNNSNLKNNYAEVKLWDYNTERFKRTGLTFCGLILGDHSKCAINTQFNTGTVVGVSSNIFGAGFPRNFVPSFSWGGASSMTEYSLKKVFEVARLVYERRDRHFDQIDEDIMTKIFEMTDKYRR